MDPRFCVTNSEVRVRGKTQNILCKSVIKWKAQIIINVIIKEK